MEPPSFFLLSSSCTKHGWMEGLGGFKPPPSLSGLHRVDNWGSRIDIPLGRDEGKSPLFTVNGSEWRRMPLTQLGQQSRCRAAHLEISLEEKPDKKKELQITKRDLVPEWRREGTSRADGALLTEVPPFLSLFSLRKLSWCNNKQDKQDKVLLSGYCPAESSHYCWLLFSFYHSAEESSRRLIITRAAYLHSIMRL